MPCICLVYTLGYLQFKINNCAFSILFELHMHLHMRRLSVVRG